MPRHRLRFELFFALSWIAFGALLLPALVYAVGVTLLGTYTAGGLGAFYGNLFADLAHGMWAPAALILGPYVILMVARLPFIARRRSEDPQEQADRPIPPSAQNSARTSRVEPRIGN